MPAVGIHLVREAGIQRRRHPRDTCSHGEGGGGGRGGGGGGANSAMAPNVHNSLAIQKKHVASMYRPKAILRRVFVANSSTCVRSRHHVAVIRSEIPTNGMYPRAWKSLNSHAFGPLDTDDFARHIPVGRVCAQRTSRAPLTESDLGNMYAGSFVFGPGPGEYDGKDDWAVSTPEKLRGSDGIMGYASRKCMTAGADHPQLPHAKRRDGLGPGPGAYSTGDSAIMGLRRGTFAAAVERRAAAATLETAVGRLKTLEWRIDFIRRGLRQPEGLRQGQALVVKTQSGRELERIEASASRLRSDVQRLADFAAAAAARRDPLPGACIGGGNGNGGSGSSSSCGKIDAGMRGRSRPGLRPATTAGVGSGGCAKRQACGQGRDRFYDPIASTATFLESPGPGTYSLTSGEGAFGRASIRRSPSFDLMQKRVVGEQAEPGRSLASLRLHSVGGSSGGEDGRDGNEDCGDGGGYDGFSCRSRRKYGDGQGTSFNAGLHDAGPGHYTPDMCAPPLPNEHRRRRRGRAYR